MKKYILILSVLLFTCNAHIEAPVDEKPLPCDIACDMLKRVDCPEGMYDMCHHYGKNECKGIINSECVMMASTRKEIIACGVKCEW